jgi:hypothetical protein
MEGKIVPHTEYNEGALSQRVADYLRTENPVTKVFAAKESAAEVELDEYLLQRAETELRQAQERVTEIRERLAASAAESGT